MRRSIPLVIGLALLTLLMVPGQTLAALANSISLPLEPLRLPMREVGVPGGRFVLAVTSPARTLNPLMAVETSSSDICDRLFTTLARFNNITQQYEPALARSWDVSADRRAWTWHLRRGARFSDGRPITSADVAFSFSVAYDTTLHPPLQDALMIHGAPIQVTAPDSFTIVTRSARPFALTVAVIASLPILPRHILEAAWRAGRFASSYGLQTSPESLVTSGPWVLKQYVPLEREVLGRNPYWFGVDTLGHRLPYLDELVFLIVPDQNTATLKFLSPDREVDGLDNVKPEDYSEFAKNQPSGSYTLYDLGPTLTSNCFWFNLNRLKQPARGKREGAPCADSIGYTWFSNRDFRRAVSMAIDRESMIRSVFFGDGVKNWSVLTAGNRIFFNPDAPKYDYDPDGAKRLLARIGFRDRDGDGVLEDPSGNPVRFVLKTAVNNNLRVQLANFLRDDLARVGIQCSLVPVAPNTMVSNIQDTFDYDAALGGFGSTIPPDPAMGANFYRSSGTTHFWNTRQARPESAGEARMDSLFEEVVSAGDLDVRRRISREMDRIIGEECWVIWLPVNHIKVPVRDRFGNLEPSAIRHRLLWNIETVFVKDVSSKSGAR